MKIKVSATFEVTATDSGCDMLATVKPKAGIPLIGKKLEAFTQEQMEKELAAEFQYIQDQL